jgi:hypothetical protein
MSTNDKIAEPRTGTSGLVRPRYAPGQMLQDDDLTQAVTYTRELNRLLLRSLLGCGVICGLVVSVEEKCGKVVISIAPGVALDCAGSALALTAAQSFVLDPSCKPLPEPPDSICVVIRGHDRSCLPRVASCGCDDDTGTTRINEGYELRLVTNCPDCGCGCDSKATPPAAAPPAETPTTPGTPKAAKKTAANSLATAGGGTPAVDCACVDPADPCYADHYAAKCSCCVDCEWVTLARVFHTTLPNATVKTWEVDHSVRRLIRPVLMKDAQAEADVKRILGT